MNRREFVKYLALIAAGANALPEQIEAYTNYYEINTPHTTDLVAIDEIFVSGLATKSTPITFKLLNYEFGINLFGGIMRWIPAPDAKLVISRFEAKWTITPEVNPIIVVGHISYVDGSMKRHFQPLSAMSL